MVGSLARRREITSALLVRAYFRLRGPRRRGVAPTSSAWTTGRGCSHAEHSWVWAPDGAMVSAPWNASGYERHLCARRAGRPLVELVIPWSIRRLPTYSGDRFQKPLTSPRPDCAGHRHHQIRWGPSPITRWAWLPVTSRGGLRRFGMGPLTGPPLTRSRTTLLMGLGLRSYVNQIEVPGIQSFAGSCWSPGVVRNHRPRKGEVGRGRGPYPAMQESSLGSYRI